jgi:hypothetical protein
MNIARILVPTPPIQSPVICAIRHRTFSMQQLQLDVLGALGLQRARDRDYAE